MAKTSQGRGAGKGGPGSNQACRLSPPASAVLLPPWPAPRLLTSFLFLVFGLSFPLSWDTSFQCEYHRLGGVSVRHGHAHVPTSPRSMPMGHMDPFVRGLVVPDDRKFWQREASGASRRRTGLVDRRGGGEGLSLWRGSGAWHGGWQPMCGDRRVRARHLLTAASLLVRGTRLGEGV